MTTTSTTFWDFVNRHCKESVDALRLKYHRKKAEDLSEEEISFAITQIECRQKVAKRLSQILGNYPTFLFSHTLLAEQCTDERVAGFHSKFFSGAKSVLDLTAGLCIDDIYIAQENPLCHVTALEIDHHSAEVGKKNIQCANLDIELINTDAVEYVSQNNTYRHYDAIFADPARRGDGNSRVYGIEQCSPNIIELMPKLKNMTNFILVKLSPMIDITDTLHRIDSITDIYIVALSNECKETLVRIDATVRDTSQTTIHALNITNGGISEISAEYDKRLTMSESMTYRMPSIGDYLYEPNVAVLKAQLQNLLAVRHRLIGISSNTHLHHSSKLIEDYCGRIFVIDDIFPLGSKEAKQLHRHYPQINVSTRNFRLSPDQLKQRLKVRDGSNRYLFGIGATDGEQMLILCHKP